jgi:hypothetical protein
LRRVVDEIFTLANVHHLMMGEEAIKDLKFTETVVDKVEELPTNFLELLCSTSNSSSSEVRTGSSS